MINEKFEKIKFTFFKTQKMKHRVNLVNQFFYLNLAIKLNHIKWLNQQYE